jgi:hypothetical protein
VENLRDRLSQALGDYFQDKYDFNTDADELADYLMEVIDELKELKRPVGSKVRIKADLVSGKNYGGTSFEEDMLQYIGKEATITYHEHEEDCTPAYLLDIDDSFWSWNEEMLEDID